MSTEHSTGAPAVAHTPAPWTVGDSGAYKVVEAHGARIATLPFQFNVEETEANAALIAAAPDLLAACDKAAEVMGWMLWDQSDRRDKNEAYTLVKTAIARARGLRPCDDPALVPEVLQAQPQCIHGEKWRVTDPEGIRCPQHRNTLRTERHQSEHSEAWYNYVCDGYLEEQREDSLDRVERLLGH